MFDQTKYPVYIQMEGSYIPFSGSSTNLEYKIYLGENASTNFTLNRNTQYNNNIKITGITNHEGDDALQVDHRVTLSPGNLINMFGEVANCYVISQIGQYNFPAYRGAFKLEDMISDNMCTKGTYVDIIARDNNLVKFKTYENGKNFILDEDENGAIVIGFEVEEMDDSNVIIALKDDEGNIEWSWHLWFVKGPELGDINTGFFDIDVQSMPGSTKKMMDRNLGAKFSLVTNGLPGTTDGLFYKYGHRNTFVSNQYWGYNANNYSVWNPVYNDGKPKKSNTDPCPPGYRVPSSTEWNSTSATNTDAGLTVAGYGFEGFRFWNLGTDGINDDIYLPYSGHLNSSNSKVTSLSSSKYTYNGSYKDVIQMSLYQTRNVTYTIQINRSHYGALHGNEKKVFSYDAMSQGLIGDAIITGGQYRLGREVFGTPIYGSWQNISGLPNTILVELRTQLNSKDENLKKELVKTQFLDADLNCGYQVRCIKE